MSELEGEPATAATDAPRLALHIDQLERLAAGYGDGATITALADAQASINRALLAAAGSALAAHTRLAASSWGLIQHLDGEFPRAVASAIAHPFFRPYAIRATKHPGESDPRPLAAYVMAAASKARACLAIPVPHAGSRIHIPGAGTALVRDGILAAGPAGELPIIVPSRYLPAGDGPPVLLEDLDPERSCYASPVEDWLGVGAHLAWCTRHETARRIITERHPFHAAGLAFVRAIVPLRPDPAGREISGTARDAAGAVAIALPEDADILALLLLHETQHAKLGAVLDLFDLFDPEDRRQYYAPWREDPRPLEGLLQGTYAHVAVTDYWRVRHLTGDADAAGGDDWHGAAVHFARWRAQTWQALETLQSSGSMTELGSRFLAGMRATLTPWMSLEVPAAAEDAARSAAAGHRAAATVHRQPGTGGARKAEEPDGNGG